MRRCHWLISSWWRHQLETDLLVTAPILCDGNPSVTGGFPSQMPLTRIFDVFFALRPNTQWANNQDAGDLRRHHAHYDVTVMLRRRWMSQAFNERGHNFYLKAVLLFDKKLAKTLHHHDVIMGTIASQITSLTVVYSIVYSDADQRKHQSSESLAFVWGIHRDRWIRRTKGQLRGNVSIWWRHHRLSQTLSKQQTSFVYLRCHWPKGGLCRDVTSIPKPNKYDRHGLSNSNW